MLEKIKALRRLFHLKFEVSYLLNEVSELREIVRVLQAESPRWQDLMAKTQTRNSFDIQWKLMPDGVHMLSDPVFQAEMIDLLESYSGLSSSWFPGKKILDAGCGNGRWSYALSVAGADVTAIDQSLHGLETTRQKCSIFNGFSCQQANLLEPLPFDSNTFDMVWSFGVLHHTGDTYKAFMNITPLVKSGGILFLMLYGEPQRPGEFEEINNYYKYRRETATMSFDKKIAYCNTKFPKNEAQAYFDAISPRINDLYRFDEIQKWLTWSGFSSIQRTFDNRNIFITAVKN
jgi:SAM-dependent methyltransferase